MTTLEEDLGTYMHSLNQSTQSFNVLQHLKFMPLEGNNNRINDGFLGNKNYILEMCNNTLDNTYGGKEETSPKDYSKESRYINISLNNLKKSNYCKDNSQMNCIIPPYYNVPFNEFGTNSNALHSLIENGTTKLPNFNIPNFNIPNLNELFEGNDKEKHIPKDIQELIYALQIGGSRCKMEAAIMVRSLATSHHNLQLVFIEVGGLSPLVALLKYVAEEVHWHAELRAKATITVRAEAALALASLSISNDYNKDAIEAVGAIPLLCELIEFNESNCNAIITFNYNNQEMAPFFILARDASAGALSCLSKSEKNKQAIIATPVIPILIRMVDEGTSFGRAAAANVIAKLATGQHATNNRFILGQEAGAIIPLLRLLKNGSSKAKETAAEALGNLALHEWNKTKILQEGGIECFMQLLENGTSAEQEAATAAMKNLTTCTLFETIQAKEKLNSGKVSSVHIVEGSNQPFTKISEHVENIGIGDFSKSMGFKNGRLTQRKEVLAELVSTTPRNELQNSDNCIYKTFQTSMDSTIWKKRFLEKDLVLPKFQCTSTLELTSTLAPSLVGQPSMQVDAMLENVNELMQSNLPSSKRMKMTIFDSKNQIPNVLCKKNSLVAESNVQKFNQPTIDSTQLRYSDANKKEIDQFLLNKNKELLHERNQCFPSTEGCGLIDTIRDQQAKQCLVVDKQLVVGGIVALVSALSSPNPSAQEFAALALMLLASQGGFEVKTAISDAGAIPLLLAMVDSSPYPMIRESAAAAIIKLVSYHNVNRIHVLKAGGIQSMVNMARWSTTLIEDVSSAENIKARVQAGAIVAVLNVGNMQDRQNTGMGLRDALPILIHMLESDEFNKVEASVGGIQALNTNFGLIELPAEIKKLTTREQGPLQITGDGTIAIEMITVLLYLTRSSSKYTKVAALEALIGFRQSATGNGIKAFEPRGGLSQEETSQLYDNARQAGVQALSIMLTKCPTSARESVTSAFACAMASDKLSIYVIDKGPIIQQLMMILKEGPTMAIRVSAAASLATIGARKKRLDVFSREHILLLLQLLTSNEYETSHCEGSLAIHGASTIDNLSEVLMPHVLLREHITAIIVYIALSGDFGKQLLITAGAAPILVGVLRGCLSGTHRSIIQESWKYMQSMLKNKEGLNGVPPYLHATQEFVVMGLIMLADKSIETMEKIVETGGISLLVQILTTNVGCKGKLGANWSEMATAALLTLAGSNNARDEIVRVGGISSLVQVLRGEGGAFQFSLTGLAAMAQLLGVLGLNSEETKLHMAKEGAVKCLVDILVEGSKYCNQSSTQVRNEENLGYVALAQEAAAAALATIILHCSTNAEAAVQAGAIGHLVKLLGPIIPNCDKMSNLETQDLLPSAYKSIRDEISFSIDTTTTSTSDFKLVLECSDSKLNSTILDDDLVEVGARTGGPLAAMVALGNMVSCYPQCWHEIVDAGAAPRLANLLKGGIRMNTSEQNNEVPQLRNCNVFPTKVQESAALVLDLLIDCEKINCSP